MSSRPSADSVMITKKRVIFNVSVAIEISKILLIKWHCSKPGKKSCPSTKSIHFSVENLCGYLLCTIDTAYVNFTSKNVLMNMYRGILGVDHDSIVLTKITILVCAGLYICRQHFQMHFLEWNLIQISLRLFGSPIQNKSVLVQIMAWCWTGDKSLSEGPVTQCFTASSRPKPVKSGLP